MESKYMKNVFKHFNEILKIYRPSFHEEKIAKYIIDFFEKKSCEIEVYEANNLLIKIPASEGWENKPVVCLQSHLDMVNVKDENVSHNWETDPIQTEEIDGWLKSKGTTLGADNGWGVAMMIEIGSNSEIKHGPLELLFTTIEEPGMIGIAKMPRNVLKAQYIINLDSEQWGTFCYRCFAGHSYVVESPITYEQIVGDDRIFVDVEVSGLRGGHSGSDVAKPRINAIKLLAIELDKMIHKFEGIRLVSFNGGIAPNSIPIKATARLSIYRKHLEGCREILNYDREFYHSSFVDEINISLLINEVNIDFKFMLSFESANKVLSTILAVSSGLRFYDFNLDTTASSNNLGIVKTEYNKILYEIYTRGSDDVMLDYIDKESMAIFKLSKFNRRDVAYYPAWSMDIKENKLIEIARNVFEKDFGQKAKLEIMPAGIECSFLSHYYPKAYMISYGPTIFDVHSPNEKLELDSASKCIDFTIDLIQAIE